MYKYSNGQISLADFRQPVGMHMKESNRWVKKGKVSWSREIVTPVSKVIKQIAS